MKKKIKSLALVLAGAVCLVGAGYAAWGNAITDNTVLNTGHWEVVLENDVDESLVASDQVGYFKKSDLGGAAVSTVTDGFKQYDKVDATHISGGAPVLGSDYVYTIEPTLSKDLKTVDFSFYNLHPGTTATTRYEIRNKGSIAAKIGNVTVSCTDGKGRPLTANAAELDKLYRAITVTGNITKHNGPGPNIGTAKTLPANTTLLTLETELKKLLVDDSFQLDPKISSNPGTLDSGEMEVNELAFTIPMTSLNGYDGMDQSLKVSINYDFVQYNELVQQ